MPPADARKPDRAPAQHEGIYPDVRIPYAAWGSSFFPAWQTSALAQVNIGQFAGEAMGRIMSVRRVPVSSLDSLVIGSTIPWHWKFWNAPLVSSFMDHRIPGFHVEQACATGLQAILCAAGEVQAGGSSAAGVLTFDRTSDSPAGVFPQRRDHRRTMVLSDVWDNFGFDPATGKAMIATAGNAARKHRLERAEVDDLTFHRHEQYFEARRSGFLDRVLVPLEVLDLQGKPLGTIDDDLGVRKLTRADLSRMPALDTCVTSGGQTHASDGMATLIVTHRERVADFTSRPEIDIRILARVEVRAEPSLMPEAPALAVRRLLGMTGLTMNDIAVVKNHNPFAVNDAVFARMMEYDWRRMNTTGCSLVWGHPQGPTLTRVTIEALEEAVALGGGRVLVFGCAAGDVGIAALLAVSESRR